MEDVLDVYKRPYDPKRSMICMDESSQQLIGEVRLPIGMRPGACKRVDDEYVRNGVANIFLAIEPLTGQYCVELTEHRGRVDWAKFRFFFFWGKYRVNPRLCFHSRRLLY